jgi:hypothetical protein
MQQLVITRPATLPLPLVAPGGPPRRKRSKLPWFAGLGGFMLLALPVVLLAGAGNPPCPTAATGPGGTSVSGPAPGGMYAAPLTLSPGRWYRVGATQYGGPSDPTAGSFGSIGDPSQAYLPLHPDTFAELSVLNSNPANSGTFTFQDANALNNLPYMTGLRVADGRVQKVLYKRDVGYGQGPGQQITNGQPYRLDVWWQSAGPLGISKSPTSIQLAPASGTGGTLGELAGPTQTPGGVGDCPTGTTTGLQLTPGQRARILADGSAAAPASAPPAVKVAIAAANQIHTKRYSVYPDGHAVHYGPLSTLWPAYDCSGTVSYVLYRAGLHSINADVSGTLESWGKPGPGRWITVYANSTHTFIDIAGLAFDTADYGGPNLPAGSGPRWRQNPTGNLADGLSYVVRHPEGL